MKNGHTIFQRHGDVFIALLSLGVALVITGVLFLSNGLALRKVTEARTQNWLLDVSDQVATLVDGRMAQSIESLNLIRDSAVLLPPQALPEFVSRKATVSGFDVLYLAENVEAAEAWICAHSSSVAGSHMVEPGKAQLIMSRAPDMGIYYAAGQTADDPVMLGTKNADLLTSMLSIQSFDGKGSTCVVTRDGVLLATSEGGTSDTMLDEWLAGEAGGEKRFEQMIADMQAGRAGAVTVGEGTQAVMVGYIPLSVNDWYVLTVIPADLLQKDIVPLVQGNLWLAVAIVIIFGGIMLTVILLRRRYQTSLEDMVFVDPLTGGMSDVRFRKEAARLLEKSKDYTLISVDVQGFKLINSIYGPKEGNRTLRHIYNTLRASLRPGELLTHASADLFYLLFIGQDRPEIERRTQEIFEKVNAFNIGQENPYYLELRFGAYRIQPDDTDVPSIEERSSTARKNGKKIHGGCTFYDAEWQRVQLEEKELVDRLECSLHAGDFQVYYQPKVRLEDRLICGAEALVRWQHPTRGLLSPSVFVPVFEKYRLISRVDQFIFEQVCRDLARWREEGRVLCPISVNLSRQNLDIPNFLERCQRIRDQYGVDRGLIEFELTETILLDNPEGVCRLIDRMHEAGFGCSMDDFGSGYSSLGLLNQLNVDTIKLDRSFFLGSNDSSRGRRVVESILKMAGKLHIATVAEGVENADQVEYLRHSACDMVQGFAFFSPMPVAEFEKKVWTEGQLRYADSGHLPPAHKAAAPRQAERSEGSIITFRYRPDTGSLCFSAPFAALMKGVTEFPDGAAFLRTSGVLNENDVDDFLEMLDRCVRGEKPWLEGAFRLCVADSGYDWMELHVHREETPAGPVVQGVLVNTRPWRNELNRWKERAKRDGLTGLYNRVHFEKSVQERLKESKDCCGAIVFIDVDDFKKVNDALGHLAGDDILRSTARRIQSVFRYSDVVARYGGDEFVVFVPNMSREALESRLDQLCAMFHNPYHKGELRYEVMGSIGVALWPQDGKDYDTLLTHADAALYEAKRRGKNQYQFYRPDRQPGDGGATE